MSEALLSSAYFGPVQWYQKLNRYDKVRVEAYDSFIKQTYRNRCVIATANGLQALTVPVERTADILGTIGPRKTKQFLCGFSMETRDMVENSAAKLKKKNLDMVVANNLKVAGAGFGVDTNVVTFITPDGTRELPLMSKADVADAILDEILKRRSL